jgi:RimJ/RimL family protein N-acetyltransferase
LIVTGKRVAQYVGDKGGTVFQQPYEAIGFERRGAIVAGAVFNNWTGPDCHVSVALEPGGVTRGFLAACSRYAFEQMGCCRVSITTEQRHVVDLALRVGGQIEGLKRDAFGPGRDGWHIGILKHEWKFN